MSDSRRSYPAIKPAVKQRYREDGVQHARQGAAMSCVSHGSTLPFFKRSVRAHTLWMIFQTAFWSARPIYPPLARLQELYLGERRLPVTVPSNKRRLSTSSPAQKKVNANAASRNAPRPWRAVSRIRQRPESDCLAACAAIVLNYLSALPLGVALQVAARTQF